MKKEKQQIEKKIERKSFLIELSFDDIEKKKKKEKWKQKIGYLWGRKIVTVLGL